LIFLSQNKDVLGVFRKIYKAKEVREKMKKKGKKEKEFNFEGKIGNELRNFISSVALFNETAGVKFDEKGIHTRVMSIDMVSLLEIELPKKDFHEWKLEGMKEVGMDVEKISRVLRNFNAYIDTELKVDSRGFTITQDSGEVKRVYEGKIVESDNNDEAVNVEFECELVLSRRLLGNVIKEIESEIKISIDEKGMLFESNEGDYSLYFKEDKEHLKFLKRKNVKVMFGKEYLAKIYKAIGDNEIKFWFGNDKQLKAEGKGIVIYVAPRVEN